LTKSIGTTNPLTLSKAALKGLSQLRSRQEVEQLLGTGTDTQEVEDAT